MGVVFRNYSGGYGVSGDYLKLHAFLARRGYAEFTYARLDWMITHGEYLQTENLKKIGLWEDEGAIVACAVFDTSMDDIYLIYLPQYEGLLRNMIAYAKTHMADDPREFRLAIPDANARYQRLAMEMGFVATPDKEMDAAYDLANENGNPTPPPDPRAFLPEGYTLVSLEEEREWRKYSLCLHKGFGHEERGEPFLFTDEYREGVRRSMERACVNLSLKIAAKGPDGQYAAYCGMWYDNAAKYAVIEPVATIPEARKMGLGRAVVTEGIRRVCALGARFAVVGSSQQFYYSIGLRPFATATFWRPGTK